MRPAQLLPIRRAHSMQAAKLARQDDLDLQSTLKVERRPEVG
jgi:hypothetical protein